MYAALPTLSDSTYNIEAEIGSGGGGVVYKAWHAHLYKYVVIKELISSPSSDIHVQRNEIEALKNVKSAYLPQVYGCLMENGRFYTVMEFIEGKSLDKLLESGYVFRQQQVVKWYGQLASALETIHSKNICHRDIKPANIMLTPDDDVCLIDFSAALVSGNDLMIISRSLGYASPEQYEKYEHFKFFYDDNKTELIDTENQTELLPVRGGAGHKPGSAALSPPGGVDWKRSDIYSLGATMYHLLTGQRPPAQAVNVVPIKKLGRFSEGVVYVIEQSMRRNPSERFASAAVLARAVSNIHKHDTRWKIARSKKIAAAVMLPVAFALFATITVLGGDVMAQEKEERYYKQVYAIENSANPQGSYDEALSIYRDRIDPYRAMAKRLWSDGDIDACREYIEQNLGNIAKFQSVPEARRSFGDIYYILGNCYYYQLSGPDYKLARDNFGIAVLFVTDNPVYYRDYAISLARTGDIGEAEHILEIARSLNLEEDSLDMLQGEVFYAKEEYDSAIESFGKVISLTNSDYLRYRAYHISDEIFRKLGTPERSVALLSGALNRIPGNRVAEMTERLADAYIRGGDFENAITLLERLSKSGAPQINIMQSLAILLQNAGEFERAADVLERMADVYPGDYRVPMRQAFLEAEKQSGIENESRDYALMKRYYDRAVMLFGESAGKGESDPEIQQLELLIEQLKAYGWFE